MRLKTEISGKTVCFMLDGEFDMYAAPDVRDEIRKCIDDGNTDILIDMQNVDYIDSSGVGVLIKILQEVRQRKGRLKFSAIHSSPRKVLDLSNILQILDVFDSKEEALKSF